MTVVHMPLFTNLVVGIALTLALMAGSSAHAEDRPHLATLALIDKPWAMRVDVTGFRIHMDGIKPDGRRYLLATDDASAIQLSVTLERVPGQATEQGCLVHLKHVTTTVIPATDQSPTRESGQHLTLLEYVLPGKGNDAAVQRHLLACTAKDDVYADIHLSQLGGTTGNHASLHALLDRLTIVAAPAPNSLDHFRAGSAPYLLGKFALAIPHYEQALALEQANPSLDRALWQLLIHNLGTAYGRAGQFGRAKATFDYGLSQDPTNPLLHYDLARTYAGMNDRDHMMQSLDAAFLHHRDRRGEAHMPDPRQDVTFGRFLLDPAFRRLTEALMQPAI